jgi:hypothetical protein
MPEDKTGRKNYLGIMPKAITCSGQCQDVSSRRCQGSSRTERSTSGHGTEIHN